MVLKSFSKINLSLNVTKKLKNGMHDIQSYFCLISLFDKISIKKIKGEKDIIKFNGKFSKFVDNKKNSISYTLALLREKNIINSHYSVLIQKNIPIFAGLGGGTGNAACLIKYFCKEKINKNLLSIFNKKIGSDLKLFFYNQGFLRDNKTIIKIKKKYSLFFLIIYPNIKSSTKKVYSKVRKNTLKSRLSFFNTNSKKKFIEFLVDSNNDLQSIVENKYPIIRKLLTEIKDRKGCYYSRMSGSGSICYGVFTSEKTAKSALATFKLKYPKFWFSVTKTI